MEDNKGQEFHVDSQELGEDSQELSEDSQELGEDGQELEDKQSEEGVPVLEVGKKKNMEIYTYVELHWFLRRVTALFEELFELRILKGTARFQAESNDDERDNEENGIDDAGERDSEADTDSNIYAEQYEKDQVYP